MLEIRNISKSYPNFCLKDISFSVDQGDYFVLLGSSGSGKSMLLEIIAGNNSADSGEIILNNKDITFEKIQKRNIAFVYQDQALFPHMSVFDNIAFALRWKKLSTAEIKKRVHDLSQTVDVENLLLRKPVTLSGGEAQRVALARALATSPEYLLLDEPLSNIDSQLRSELRGLLRKLNRQGQTIIHVTHDYEEAVSLAGKIAVIEHGKIMQSGTPEEIFMFPKSEFVANFIGVKNFFKGRLFSSLKNHDLKTFETAGIQIETVAEENSGEGCLMIPAESVFLSETFSESSALNNFKGKITDIFPSKSGLEIVIDIGIIVTAVISKLSAENLHLETGKEIWISFKASSVKYLKV